MLWNSFHDCSAFLSGFSFGLNDGKALIKAFAIGGPSNRMNGISVAKVHTKMIGINAEPIGSLK
jgi:hypothetical protein